MSTPYELVSDGVALEIYQERDDTLIEVIVPGPQGPPGPIGPTGPAAGFDFTQVSASALWTIAHNLGHYPVIDVRDLGGNVLLAEVIHLSLTTAQVAFITSVAGTARCI